MTQRLVVFSLLLIELNESAAISNGHHTSLRHLGIVSVFLSPFGTFASGDILLPGMVSRDLPPSCNQIVSRLCGLTQLPDNIDPIWRVKHVQLKLN